MKRREILKYVTLLTGAAVSAPLASSLLSGCNAPVADTDIAGDYQLQFFSEKEFSLIRDLIDTILPKTDSPSASEVGVHKMIDQMVGEVYDAPYRDSYKKGFASLVEYLNKEAGGKGFSKLEPNKKIALLQSLGSSGEDDLKGLREAYLNLKQQTVAYYLSTKEIGTKFLNYLPIPGEYKACIPLAEVGGKAWAI